MIILAVLPYVPKTKDKCSCEEEQTPLYISIGYYILYAILMIIVAILVYRYLRREGGLDEEDLLGFCIFTSPLILIPGLNSFVLMLLAMIATAWLLFSLIAWLIKKLKS